MTNDEKDKLRFSYQPMEKYDQFAWQHDLEFISNYNLGDMPEVIIEKLIIGKRM